MKRVFQLYDQAGAPQGGHVFVAPSEATLELQLQAQSLPDGWTRVEIQDEGEIVQRLPGDYEVLD